MEIHENLSNKEGEQERAGERVVGSAEGELSLELTMSLFPGSGTKQRQSSSASFPDSGTKQQQSSSASASASCRKEKEEGVSMNGSSSAMWTTSPFPELFRTKSQQYSRKEKSLGLLCTNFLSLYEQSGVGTIGLDDASKRLGVERRRIYDIVNVLESIGVIVRRGKNLYTWIGLDGIPKALNELKEEGLKENSLCIFDASNSSRVPACGSNGSSEKNLNPSSALRLDSLSLAQLSKLEVRREKSLGILTVNFIKLFLCTDVELVTLDEAARILLGDSYKSSNSNSAAKVRRLYDIANVLSSINMIEKTHVTPQCEAKKPAFRWLGYNGIPENILPVPRKRVFGVDLSNTTHVKRTKVASCINQNQNSILGSKVQKKNDDLNDAGDCNQVPQQHQPKERSKDVVFGPFGPTKVGCNAKNDAPSGPTKVGCNAKKDAPSGPTKVGCNAKNDAPSGPTKVGCNAKNNAEEKEVQGWEKLASTHRPQYRNEALSELFAHYVEAWKSWYVEIVGKPPIELRS